MNSEFVTVDVPRPLKRPKAVGGDRPHLVAARALAAERRRMITKIHKAKLLETLRAPPADYDGTNKKLAEYLHLSIRQVIRLIRGLEADGKLKIRRQTQRLPHNCIVYRTIQIKDGVA